MSWGKLPSWRENVLSVDTQSLDGHSQPQDLLFTASASTWLPQREPARSVGSHPATLCVPASLDSASFSSSCFGRLGSDIVSRAPCCKAQNSHFLQPLPKSASAAVAGSHLATLCLAASLDSAAFSSSCFGRLTSFRGSLAAKLKTHTFCSRFLKRERCCSSLSPHQHDQGPTSQLCAYWPHWILWRSRVRVLPGLFRGSLAAKLKTHTFCSRFLKARALLLV